MFEAAPVFCGLGKASLKLDFETKDELNDYCARMLAASNTDNDPDPEKAAKTIINNLYRRTTGDAYMKPHKGGVDGPGDVYLITDTRSKAKKELDEIKALQRYDVKKLDKETLRDIEKSDPLLFEQLKSDLNTPKAQEPAQKSPAPEIEKVNKVVDEYEPTTPGGILYKCIFDTAHNRYYKTDNIKKIEPLIKFELDPEIWNVHRNNRSDAYTIAPGYTMNIDKELIADAILRNNLYKNEHLNLSFIQNAYRDYLNDIADVQYELDNILKDTRENYYDVTVLKRILKKVKNRVDKIKAFQNKFLNGDYFGKKDGLGKTANNLLYNNLDILETGGMVPTYQILPSYDQFFKPAQKKNTFAGFGLDDTKTLIADICRKHYKECAPIAAHLKADTLLQSCFNLWHWLHNNIKYEYDRDDREEVRTPLRVWADRKRGVDCDCLSVFAWCVLKCMGYNPAFELVAFKGRPQYSHIFINCDGVVVDRVWFIFNQRPPFVTKREIYKVNLTNNLGDLF